VSEERGAAVVSIVRSEPRGNVAALLRALADDADRGELIGVCVVTELTGGRVGSAFIEPHDVHRALGGVERLRARLLAL
jgi:hypothetical protein